MKRLLSLNLVLIMLFSLLSSTALAADTQTLADTHIYENYFIIDGTEYDATARASGDGWNYWSFSSGNVLTLNNYSGDSISANVPLTVRFNGDNTIQSTSGYAIYSSQDLTISSYVNQGIRPNLSVFGKYGYEAVRSEGALTIETDYFTATGGSINALAGNPIVLDPENFIIQVGSSASTAAEGSYTNQKYFCCERINDYLILNGNGGTTTSGDTTCRIYCSISTPGIIDLYPHTERFYNEGKLMLGWSEFPDGSGIVYDRDENHCPFVSKTGDAMVYAIWESDINNPIYLNNYYGVYYNGGQRIALGIKGKNFVLPDQQRGGCQFNGWRGEDGILYPAGTEVPVSGPMTYTAEFTALTLSVAGKEYDASMTQGSFALGWRYSGGTYSRAYLYIYNNYTGEPINVPFDVSIYLHGSVTGTDGVPAIDVIGDATIISYISSNRTDNPAVVTGGEGAPAVQCTEELRISVYDFDEGDDMTLILQGGKNQPALKSKNIDLSSCKIYTDADRTTQVTTYSGENYLLLKEKPYEAPVVPATPEITVGTRASDGKPQIKWNAVDNATEYEVWYSGTKNGTYTKLITTESTKLSVTHTGAKAGNDYFYKVCAVNGSATSEFSAIKGVWCDLARPTVKVTNRASDGKPVISWTKVDGATGYEVYRCGASTGTYTLLYTAKADKLSVTHTGAAVGNDYFYKVKALYGDNSSCDSALSAAKGVWVDLERPTIKVVNSTSSGKPVISWSKVDYAVGYKVYCAVGSSTGEYKQIYNTANPNKLSVTHIGAEAGEAYFYKVVAVHKNSKCTSGYSSAKGVYCDLARPTLTVTLNSSGKPYLSWTESEGAASYKVYRSTNGADWTLMYTAKANDFDVNHSGAKADTTYFYKVVAVCEATSKGNSAYSLVKSITVE